MQDCLTEQAIVEAEGNEGRHAVLHGSSLPETSLRILCRGTRRRHRPCSVNTTLPYSRSTRDFAGTMSDYELTAGSIEAINSQDDESSEQGVSEPIFQVLSCKKLQSQGGGQDRYRSV